MRTVAVIGGDERALRLALLFEKKGDTVYTWGLRRGEEACPAQAADVLLFPYPFSAANGLIPNLLGLSLEAEAPLAWAKAGAYVLLGERLEIETPWEGKPLRLLRYGQDEDFLLANADISAEGALCCAMRQLPCTVAGCETLVVGYGRFGRALALKLKALGSRVTVAARSPQARERAMVEGLNAISMAEIPQAAEGTRVLFNTVAARVVGEKALKALPPDALLLEGASAPYGFDQEAAQALGLEVSLLPGIPGRYAPQSAAQALYEAACRLMVGSNV